RHRHVGPERRRRHAGRGAVRVHAGGHAADVARQRRQRPRQREALAEQRRTVLLRQAHVGAGGEDGAGQRAVEPAVARPGGATAVDADRAGLAVVVDVALAAESATVGVVAGDVRVVHRTAVGPAHSAVRVGAHYPRAVAAGRVALVLGAGAIQRADEAAGAGRLGAILGAEVRGVGGVGDAEAVVVAVGVHGAGLAQGV